MPGYDTTEPRLRCVLPFEAVPAEVTLLRRAAAKQLGDWGLLLAVDDAELIVTELATNVLKHVGEGASAALTLEWRGERLRVEVHDKDPMLPCLRPAVLADESGRGLHLLSVIAVEWGTVVSAFGKVWCEIPLTSGNSCLRLERAVKALESYENGPVGRRGRQLEASLEESAIELIADLLHWTATRGQDPDDMLDQAQMRYDAEVDAA